MNLKEKDKSETKHTMCNKFTHRVRLGVLPNRTEQRALRFQGWHQRAAGQLASFASLIRFRRSAVWDNIHRVRKRTEGGKMHLPLRAATLGNGDDAGKAMSEGKQRKKLKTRNKSARKNKQTTAQGNEMMKDKGMKTPTGVPLLVVQPRFQLLSPLLSCSS